MKKYLILILLFNSLCALKAQDNSALIDTTVGLFHVKFIMTPPATINRSFDGDSLTSVTLKMECYTNNDSNLLPSVKMYYTINATAQEVREYQNTPYYKQYYSGNSYLADYYLYPLLIAKAKKLIDFNHIEKYIGTKIK